MAVGAQLIAVVQSAFQPFERSEAIERLLGEDLSEFYHRRDAGLLKLEGLAQEIIERNEEYRRTIDLKHDALEGELRRKYEEKMKELEEERKLKNQELENQREVLGAEKKELDDRSATHMRRQLRQDMKNIIKDRGAKFSLTTKTNHKRIFIHIVFVFGILSLVGLAAHTLWKWTPSESGAVDWVTLVRLAIATVGALLAMAWYIRWNDNWFRQHADEEFNIKRLELDLDRADWVVEMAMEWHTQKGKELPPELIDRLTANLFVLKGSQIPNHPSQDVASALLGATSKLSLNLPGSGHIELDRKGAHDFKKGLGSDKS
jgi:hypothetical protein